MDVANTRTLGEKAKTDGGLAVVRKIIIEDLQNFDVITDNMIIKPTTKNIHLLGSKEIEHLNIYSFNQKQFEKIISLINVKSLSFYEFRVEDLSPLETLDRVENLSLIWNTKVINLWDMSKSKQLRQLLISDFSKLRTIDLLTTAPSIELLELSGGIWNRLNIVSLKPLSELEQIKQLTLNNIKVDDQCLEPISKLNRLEVLEISNQFPVEEFAKLSMELTQTECKLFSPYTKLKSPIGDKDIMITGKGKPFLNSLIDGNKIKTFESDFKKLQEQYSLFKK